MRLISIFSQLLKPPATFRVPSVYLNGHFRIRTSTIEEQLKDKTVIAIEIFGCEEAENYDRHLVGSNI